MTEPTPAPTFANLDLPDPLQAAVADLGFTEPTAIQAQTIPVLLAGRDITGVAQTGTGKTAAYGLPLLAAIDPEDRRVQGLVLTPTRELALQVAQAITRFATHLEGLHVAAIYGGAPYLPQQRALSAGAQVVVGTPGRVIDHLNRATLNLQDVRYLVLDEADEMLRMGFAEDVDTVFSHTPATRQVALFSATMPPGIRRVAAAHLTDPVEIAVARQASTVASVRQTYAIVAHRHKIGSLLRVIATSEADATIVFTRTRGAADEVGSALVERGLSAATISGDVPQKERERIVERLRTGALDVLVATDVAARGLDVERVGLVVNFDVPGEPEAYVHRIGRTGRAGRAGRALTFVTPHERAKLRSIERLTRTPLDEVEIPSPADVSAHRARTLLAQIPERTAAGRLGMYTDLLRAEQEATGSDPLTTAAALLALAVGDDGPRAHAEQERFEAERDQARAARKAERKERTAGRGRERSGRGPTYRTAGTRYKVAVGYTHGAQAGGIVGALTNEAGLHGTDLGKIDVFPSFSLVDIAAPLDAAALERISRVKVAGRALRIRVDEGAPTKDNRSRRIHPGARGRGPTVRPRPARAD